MNIHHNDKSGNAIATGILQPLPTREKDSTRAYTGSFSATPTGAADYFGYLENKSTEDLYVLVKSIYLTASELVTIESSVPGTPAGTTTVTLANKRLGDAALPVTLGLLQFGVDLNSAAGLVTTGAVPVYALQSAATSLSVINAKYILAPGRVLQFLAGTGTTAIRVNIDVWYE
jgi:hypothetical protein